MWVSVGEGIRRHLRLRVTTTHWTGLHYYSHQWELSDASWIVIYWRCFFLCNLILFLFFSISSFRWRRNWSVDFLRRTLVETEKILEREKKKIEKKSVPNTRSTFISAIPHWPCVKKTQLIAVGLKPGWTQHEALRHDFIFPRPLDLSAAGACADLSACDSFFFSVRLFAPGIPLGLP